MRRWLVVCSLLAACGDDAVGSSPDGAAPRPDAAPALPTSTTLVLTVTDGEGGRPLPSRVILFNLDGTPVNIGVRDMWGGIDQDRGYCDLGPGVVGTWEGFLLADGTGEVPVGRDRCMPSPAVPFGRYRLVALQGIEHELFETTVDLGPNLGRVVVNAPLRRAFSIPDGALAADLHIHAAGSADSTLPRDVRVISELATGMQVLGSSDHDNNGSFDDEIDALGLRGRIASLAGNEATASQFHAGVFPAVIDRGAPQNGAPVGLPALSAAQAFARLHGLPGSPLVQLNHPRLRYAAYFDYAGWDGRSWPPPMPLDFDTVEVLHGMSAFNLPTDMRIEEGVQDLYTLVEHGRLVTAVGNSDTHHLSGVLAGVPRNYVFVDDPRLEPFDVDGFVAALRARRVMLTTAPWLEVHVGEAITGGTATATAGKVAVRIALRQASWSHATRARLWVDDELRETLAIPPGATEWSWSGEVEVGAVDGWIGVDATGDDGIPREVSSVWPEKPPMPPFAMINPILVDADGDGRWTAPAGKPVAIPDLPPAPPGLRAPAECEPPFWQQAPR